MAAHPVEVSLLVLVVIAATILSGNTAGSSPGITVPTLHPTAPESPTAPSGTIEVAPGFSPTGETVLIGPVANATTIDVAVALAPRNPGGLNATVASLYTPGSVDFHHFLSDARLASDFGPSASTRAAALAYFGSYGLSTTASPDGLLLDVAGSATNVARAFGTSFETFRRPDGSTFVSHSSAALLPAGIPWAGVLGLGNESPIAPAAVPDPVAEAGPETACSGGSVIAPCQLWNAYDSAGLISTGTNGSGETVAVVDAYTNAEPQSQLASDLGDFDAAFDLPTPQVQYMYPVPAPGDLNTTILNADWETEDALDLEWAHASAPGADLEMAYSPNDDVGLYEVVDFLVAHQSSNVISMSWGEPDVGVYNAYEGPCASACNASSDGSYALLGSVLEFAAAEGISVFAASGDCGAADGTSGDSTNFPASDPYVTGVGGTQLTVNASGTWESESGWSGNSSGATSPGCSNAGGSGGGYAPFPHPYWQAGTGVPADATHRGVPDVSAIATPGALLYVDGELSGVGGTSLATPVWAGIAAIADQYSGGPLGFLNPSLYSILRSARYASDFRDITSGNNGYSAGPGWDPVTGVGTPIVAGLVTDLAAPVTLSSTLATAVAATPSSGFAPLTVTFSVNATGGTGAYVASGVSFGDGTSGFASDGAVVHTYLAPGVYPAQSYVFDSSGNASTSEPIAIVVGGGSAVSVALASSDATPAAGATVRFNVTVSGGTAPYAYYYWFGDGTFENWTASPSTNHTYGAAGGFCAEVVVTDSAVPPDGGVSLPLPESVGGAASPSCPEGKGPLNVTATNGAVRDAPADFPSLFHVAGGSGTISEQYVSTDPYVRACLCTIFRSAGDDSVTLFVNDSAGGHAVAEANVTVAPALIANFTAGPTYGTAPLTVSFAARAQGGDGADAASTRWTFGNGNTSVGDSAEETYGAPGTYWAVGALSDLGDGNASEAFQIDVLAPGATEGAHLRVTIDPATDASSAANVTFSAAALSGAGAPLAASYRWSLPDAESAYLDQVNRTFFAPVSDAGAYRLNGSIAVDPWGGGAPLSATFNLTPFFAVESGGFVPRADALEASGTAGPTAGPAPLNWSGQASASGPGTVGLEWAFGNEILERGASASTSYPVPGQYTAMLWANDSWGDRAVLPWAVDVTNASIAISATASVTSGVAPLTVRFSANASGGAGAPYAFNWSFGDGASAPAANATHTYRHGGSFTARITVRDSVGELADRTFSIVVENASATAVPLLPTVALVGGIAFGALLAVAAGVRRRRRASP